MSISHSSYSPAVFSSEQKQNDFSTQFLSSIKSSFPGFPSILHQMLVFCRPLPTHLEYLLLTAFILEQVFPFPSN